MEKKLRYSHQREMIYQCLMASSEHPSAEMLYNDLREKVPGLSLGTVYRNLRLLEELGKVRRVASFQGSDRYDAWCEDHVHLICADCGSVQDVKKADTEAIRKAVSLEDGFEMRHMNLTLTGLCPACAGKQTGSSGILI